MIMLTTKQILYIKAMLIRHKDTIEPNDCEDRMIDHILEELDYELNPTPHLNPSNSSPVI